MTGYERRDARPRARPGGSGQATVEFALVLPLFVALLALLVQVALVARDEILVVHAARAAVREASVTANDDRVVAAARRSLPAADTRVVRRGPVGDDVEVEVTYVSKTDLPIVGALLPDLDLKSRAVMRVER
jgi:Flp pilus assembly protein TadG